MSRDQTVFVDENGKAYQFYSSENNATLYISELTDDYLKPTGRYTRNFVKQSREAPAVFKYNGKYYMLSSGCTGWDPNVAELAVADSIMGQWTTIGNPCTGPDADKTFYAQSTYVQQVYGKGNAYIAMFDRWKKKNLEDSRYVWLPLEFGKDGTITIPWRDSWDLRTWRNSAAYASRTTCMSSCARDRMSVPNGKWADCPGGYSRKKISACANPTPTVWSV